VVRTIRSLSVLVLTVFVLAACGDSGSSNSAASAATTAAPAASDTATTSPASTEAATTEAAATTAGAASTAASASGGSSTGKTCSSPLGDISTAKTTLTYQLDSFSITGPATVSAAAGPIGFDLTNVAKGAQHEFRIIQGDSYASLPKNANGTVDETQLPAGADLGVVAKFPGDGTTCTGVFDLKPGKYVLICNIEFKNGPTIISHAGKGMHLDFTVTA